MSKFASPTVDPLYTHVLLRAPLVSQVAEGGTQEHALYTKVSLKKERVECRSPQELKRTQPPELR